MGVLNPYLDPIGIDLTKQFYQKYFPDNNSRKILFGINPGRFGGGVTGIPFTDPVVLEEVCDIKNDLQKRAELSSDFIYRMIQTLGGADKFYSKYFISAISPLGYIQEGKNLNYYDMPNWKNLFDEYVVDLIKQQLAFNVDRSEAFSIGQGENMKYLKYLNDKHQFFERITPLPHPRWVMQYRRKRIDEFIDVYKEKLPLE